MMTNNLVISVMIIQKNKFYSTLELLEEGMKNYTNKKYHILKILNSRFPRELMN